MTKNGNVIVTETDKSSKLCLDTIPEYIAMAAPHISDDKVVTAKEVATIEKLMNAHSYQLCRIFGVCSAWEDGSRVKSAREGEEDHARPGPQNCHAGRVE